MTNLFSLLLFAHNSAKITPTLTILMSPHEWHQATTTTSSPWVVMLSRHLGKMSWGMSIGGITKGEMSAGFVWGDLPRVQGRNVQRECLSDCLDPRAGSQVTTCSGYDLCQPT